MRMSVRRCAITIIVILLGIAPARGVFALVPSDPFFVHQWYLEKVGAPAAWDLTIGNPTAVIAVLDVGVDLDHPDLQGAIWSNPDEVAGNGVDDDHNGYVDDVHGWDFVNGDNDPTPSFDITSADPRDLHHGTIVAGIIAARGNNGEGIAGIDWLAKIMPLRVLHSDGSGDVDTVLPALRYAMAEGATIINLSFVGDERSTDFDQLIAEAERKGVLVVAAGGNEDRRGQGDLNRFPVYPICSGADGQSVLGVAATNQQDGKATFSSYGRCVDLAAPGERIVGTLFHDPVHLIIQVTGNVTASTFSQPYGGFFSGTSFAAPIAAGAASLVRGLLPSATPKDVIALLQRTADPVNGNATVTPDQLGSGRVNIARAVVEAQRQASAIPSPASSRLTVSTPLAGLGEMVTVRAEVRSGGSFPIIGRAVTIQSSRASDVVSPNAPVTDAQGVATVSLRASSEGIAELTAMVDQQVVGTARVVFVRALAQPVGAGSLLRGSAATVYIIGSDGKRYAFPDAQTHRSWYPDTNGVARVPDAVLSAFPLGGLVTIRPGTFLVKVQTDPKVYAVEGSGTLRWIASEEVARTLYGDAWNHRIVDVPDAFFATYHSGEAVGGVHPMGALLEDIRNGERYLVAAGQRRHITSTLAFLKNGFQWRDIVQVPAVSYPDGAPIVDREPLLASPVL